MVKKKALYSHLNHLNRVAISVTASKGLENRCVHSNTSDLWICFSGHQAITNQEILKGLKENDLNSKHVNIISLFTPLRVRIQGIFPLSKENFEFIATQSTFITGWERVQLWEQIASLIYNTPKETAVQNSLTSQGECFTVQRATVHSVNIITGALTSLSTLI